MGAFGKLFFGFTFSLAGLAVAKAVKASVSSGDLKIPAWVPRPGPLPVSPRAPLVTPFASPAAPSPPAPAARAPTPMWTRLSPPYQLKNGAHYFARLSLSGFEKMMASKGVLSDKFQSVGFKDVQIFESKPELGAHAPAGAGQSGPWAEGTYGGPSQQVTLPSQVVEVWVVGGVG